MPRNRFIPLALLLFSALPCATFAQLRLDDPVIPQAYHEKTRTTLEQEIADYVFRLSGATPADAVVLNAQQRYRQVALRLLVVGYEAGADGAVATLAAHTLIDSVETFDALIAPLPNRVRRLLSQPDPDPAERQRLVDAVEALRRFNELTDRQIHALSSARPDEVDVYLKHMLAPLTIVVTQIAGETPKPTWVTWSADLPGRKLHQSVGIQHIARLVDRIESIPLPQNTRETMTSIATRMQQAVDRPQHQPFLRLFHQHLTRLLDASHNIATSDWLASNARDQMHRDIHNALLLMQSVETRDEVMAGVDRISRFSQAISAIDRVALKGQDVSALRELFLVAHSLNHEPRTQPTAGALLDYVTRITQAMLDPQEMSPDRLPLDVRKVFVVIQRQLIAERQHLLASLPALAADPYQVTQPRWTAPLTRIESLHTQAKRLHGVPDWLQRMSVLNPNASRGFYQQLRLISQDLLDESTHTGAAAALDQLDHQLALFESLPYEKRILKHEATLQRFVGDTLPGIHQQLFILRSQWAASWSAGADPTAYGDRLMLLRRLFVHIHQTNALLNKPKPLHKLNRWAGWEVPQSAIDSVLRDLPSEVGRACALAAAGHWDQLEIALDTIDERSPVARLTALLASRLCTPMASQPDGVSGVLSQCLYAPNEDSYAASERVRLAQLSVTLNAADYLRSIGRKTEAQELLNAADSLAMEILQRLTRADEPADV